MENDPKPLLLSIETTPFCMTMMTKTIEGRGLASQGWMEIRETSEKKGKLPARIDDSKKQSEPGVAPSVIPTSRQRTSK